MRESFVHTKVKKVWAEALIIPCDISNYCSTSTNAAGKSATKYGTINRGIWTSYLNLKRSGSSGRANAKTIWNRVASSAYVVESKRRALHVVGAGVYVRIGYIV